MTGLTVAVCTYRRPDQLALTVRALQAELGPTADVQPAEIVVVDNDPDGGARPTVDAATGRLPVRYVHEPVPGIAAARNRCLAEATTPLLVFLDDDEHPCPGWFATLATAWAGTGAEAVAGPVVAEFEVPPDAWIAAGEFFVRQRWPSGTVRPVAATNNLLLDLRFVRRHGLAFDPAFGLTGGSDTLFTRRLTAVGGRIVWADDAVVLDRTPPERANRAWVLRRARRTGNTAVRVELALAGGTGARAVVRARGVAAGLARTVGGLVRAGRGRLTGSAVDRARGARTAARGRGMLAAAAGRTQVEYARPAEGTSSSAA